MVVEQDGIHLKQGAFVRGVTIGGCGQLVKSAMNSHDTLIGTRKTRNNRLFCANHLRNRLFLQAFTLSLVIFDERYLRVTPGIKMAYLMDALNGAVWSTPLFGMVLAVHVGVGVFKERDARSAALLRTPANDAVLVDVKISCSGSATPFILPAIDKGILKPIPASV
jgi:hypothetical protein